jgi:hypothetical protein
MLFAKEVNDISWKDLMGNYQSKTRPFYTNMIGESLQGYKKRLRGGLGDEHEYLFTYNEDKPEGLAASTRKLTVKRTQTLARTLRASAGEKATRVPGTQSDGLLPFEAFEQALAEIVPLVVAEQRFVELFFHANTIEEMDFAEVASAVLPESRRAPFPQPLYIQEPDPAMKKLVASMMNELFMSLQVELRDLINWATSIGPLQGIGILNALYRTTAALDDNFLLQNLDALATRYSREWDRHVEAQIHSIEETKVKIHKRKGVIPFMKTFPLFAMHIEDILTPADGVHVDARKLVDEAYEKINKAMFESLRVIAKESPATAPHGGAGDPEDKEALNYHILLIENMNYYVEHVEAYNDRVLLEGKIVAKADLDEHLSLYVDAVIRRPLGKIMVRTHDRGKHECTMVD